MLKKTTQKGFTIVELLIVIVVIGILAALVLNTFSGVQKRARDTQRQTSVNSLSTQLEVYYNDQGGYPATADVASDPWIQKNLKGFDIKATRAPSADSNSYAATATPTKDQFGYEAEPSGCVSPTNADGDKNTGTFCAGYKLHFFTEDKGNVVTKESLNKSETTTP